MRKKASFTKGQWIAVGRRVEHPNDRIPDICSCMPEDFGQEGRSDEEACANARLIAAAPTMLNVLRAVRVTIKLDMESAKIALADCGHEAVKDYITNYQADLDIINDAITLATGEQA